MIALRVEGTTRVLGKQQGYLGLPIKDEVLEDGVEVMTSSWEPTPIELEHLNNGAPIRVQLVGVLHPPIKVEVGVR